MLNGGWWSLYEWDQCYYKKKHSRNLPCFFQNMRTHKGYCSLWMRKLALSRNQTCQCLDPRLPAPEQGKINFYYLIHPFCGIIIVAQMNYAMLCYVKSLQLCPTLCDPIDGSPPGFPIPGILQARTLEWVAISFSNAWKWKEKVKSLSHVWLLTTPWTAAYQAPPSMGFSRQEYWSGVPLPSPKWTKTVLNIIVSTILPVVLQC